MLKDRSSDLPSGVEVRFNAKKCVSAGKAPPQYYVKTYKIADFSSEDFAGLQGHPGNFIIHDHAYAIYDGGGGPPINQPVLDALAKQLAIDFYNWRTFRYNLVINGIINPQLDASIDLFEVVYLNNECYSRLSTGPFNGEPEEFFHIDQDCAKDNVVYVPKAKRRGNFLQLPKAHVITDDCGNLSLQTSSYDEVFICCSSSSSSHSGSSHQCPTNACGHCINPAECGMAVVLPAGANNLYGPTIDNPVCGGLKGVFVMVHKSGCTWTFTNVDPVTGFGITLILTNSGSGFQLEGIITGSTGTGIAFFDGTGFTCQNSVDFPLLGGTSTCLCSSAPPASNCVSNVHPS